MANGWSDLASGIRGKRQLEQGDEIAAAALQDLAGGGQQQIPGAQPMPQGMPQGMPGAGSPGGGGQPQGSPPQGGPPPQFGQPQAQGGVNPFQAVGRFLSGQPAGGPPGGGGAPPPQPSQGPPAAPPSTQPIPGQRPMPGMQQTQPQTAGAPVRPQVGPGAGGQGGRPQGPLDLRTVIQSVTRAAGQNANPHQVMAAVGKLMPLMTADSQMQFREISLQLREQMLMQQQNAANMRQQESEANRGERAREANQRPEIRMMNEFYQKNPDATPQDAAKFFSGQVKGGQQRADTQTANREQRWQMHLNREADKTRDYEFKVDQAKQKAAAAKTKQEFDQAYKEFTTARKAEDAYVRERISASNILEEVDKKAALAAADAKWKANEAAMQQLKRQGGAGLGLQGGTAAGGTAADPNAPKVPDRAPVGTPNPAAPLEPRPVQTQRITKPVQAGGPTIGGAQGVPVPPGLMKDPDGSRYEKDRKTYVKQGNQLVPETAGE